MLITIAGADTSPVTMALLKEHLRVDHNDDDATIGAYRDAAVAWVETETSRILARKTLELRIGPSSGESARPVGGGWDWLYQSSGPWPSASWPGCIEIPAAPVRDVRQVSYLDEDGAEQTLAAQNWTWDATATGAVVSFVRGWSPPRLASWRPGVIRVQFDAGYDEPDGATGTGEDPALTLPRQAKPAVLILAAHWYENRSPIVEGSAAELPLSVQGLINQLRIWR